MRSKAVKSLALALLVCGTSMSAAQQSGPPAGGFATGSPPPPKQKAPEKSKLEEMLAEALRNNPDIRVAAAKLAEAEAELNRTRLQVTQKVVLLNQTLVSQKAAVADAQKTYERLAKSGTVTQIVLDQAKYNLRAVKAKLEELEAQLPGLLGKSIHAEASAGDVGLAARLALELVGQQPNSDAFELYRLALAEVVANPHKSTGPMAERLRKALQTPIKVDYKNRNFSAILKDLETKAPGLSFRNLAGAADSAVTINLRFEEALPVSAILQALSDETNCRFYVREYGILATMKENTPPGALTVEEFMRQKAAEEQHRQPTGGKNPPLQNVTGHVKAVDTSGLIMIDIGSEAGLVKGHTLELTRMPDNPVLDTTHHLGTIRIMEVKAKEAVGQALGHLRAKPKVGDFVTNTRILGN